MERVDSYKSLNEKKIQNQMFNSRTLFIVGAGASKEVGLPVGTELAEIISENLYFEFDIGRTMVGDRYFLEMLKRALDNDYNKINEFLAAARIISSGVKEARSIDNFIDARGDNEFIAPCGKAAIVGAILNKERSSRIFIDKSEQNSKLTSENLNDTWFDEFSNILQERISIINLDNIYDNMSIICFNYDRCIQQVLSHIYQPLYSIDQTQSRDLFEKLRIFYPYGTVGPLNNSNAQRGIEFGADSRYLNLLEGAKSIKTYSEQIQEVEIIEALRNEVSAAETIIFLGFAFHPQNMELLKVKKLCKAKRIFATAVGISDEDIHTIESQIKSILKLKRGDETQLKINIRNDLSCAKLLRTYRRSLSLL